MMARGKDADSCQQGIKYINVALVIRTMPRGGEIRGPTQKKNRTVSVTPSI